MRVWGLAHSDDGWRLHVIEAPAWRVALENYGVPAINRLTGHLFCCRIPQLAFKIPVGQPEWVDDFLANSVGGRMFDLGQWINRLGTLGHAANEAWVQIEPDVAFGLDPELFVDVEATWAEHEDDPDSRADH